MQGGLEIIKGDATMPRHVTADPNELRVILHICNDINRWGKGFVVPLGDRYPAAKDIYLKSASPSGYHQLGSITHAQIVPTLLVVNMVAQHGIMRDKVTGEPPIRYAELRKCLARVRELLDGKQPVSLHMPKIGCGLAGGDWNVVSDIINSELVAFGHACTVYVQ
jgi:hypothetical protein